MFLVEIPARFSADTNKITLKCVRESKGTVTAKTILKKKNRVGEVSLPNFNTYTDTVIRTVLLVER